MNELERIKRDLNIEDFGKLSPEQMTALFDSVGKANYSLASLHAIAPMVPHFSTMAVEALHTLKDVTARAANTHEKALEGLNQALKNLEVVAHHPNASANTLDKVVEGSAEIAKEIAALSRTWADFFKSMGQYAWQIGGVVVVGVIGVAAAGRSNRA